jgi:hypothetical protein
MSFFSYSTPNNCLIYDVAITGRSHVGITTPICMEQFLAKKHHKNKEQRTKSFFSLCLMHNSQVYESSSIFLRRNIALVFGYKSNQKNTLCFIWQDGFQIQPKAECTACVPWRWLYDLVAERGLHSAPELATSSTHERMVRVKKRPAGVDRAFVRVRPGSSLFARRPSPLAL